MDVWLVWMVFSNSRSNLYPNINYIKILVKKRLGKVFFLRSAAVLNFVFENCCQVNQKIKNVNFRFVEPLKLAHQIVLLNASVTPITLFLKIKNIF
jgi:hypothetical protein